MSENNTGKPNFNDPKVHHEFNGGNKYYENSFGEPSYLPASYDDRNYRSSFYDEENDSHAGSFLFGALVGGVIGAATALFLAPKSGSEMREDFSSQATQLKAKSIEISSVAKEKATEFTSVAKEKTGGLSKTIQEQSGQLVDKVKSMTSKTSVPMDDGTVSSEGEEAIEYTGKTASTQTQKNETGEEPVTSTAEALKEAVIKPFDKHENSSPEKQKTGNSSVSYNNAENIGDDKITNQNYVSDINDDKSK